MATKDFIFKPGETVSENIQTWLEKIFSPEEREKMHRHGARVRIIATTPWPKPPKIPKPKIVIDANFIAGLKRLASDENALEREITNLNGPQILQIGQIVGIPMAKKTKLASLRAQLINSLRSEIVWRSITGVGVAESTHDVKGE